MVEVMSRVKEHTVECSTSSTLCKHVFKQSCNMDSDTSKVLTHNNSDVDRQSGKTGQDLRVPVLNMCSRPLMPTTPGKARKLLNQDKAKVISRKPFTIQLKYATGEAKQLITLGVDAGYKNVGVSVVSGKNELFSAEIILRTDIPKKIQNRSIYRKNRRSRLWHREPRFLNRAKPKGWLAPSIQHKLDSHVRIVNKLMNLFPITDVIVEVASFDIQKIKNPEINGKEYQQGEQMGFWNTREYVLHRDNHTCQHCKGKSGDKILQVHHINGKKEGATNRPEELLTVCKTCHEKHHKGISTIPDKEIHRFKPETFMTIVRWKLVNVLNCKYTYGYITKQNRIKQNLEKSHINDAFVIAGGRKDMKRSIPFDFKQIRRNNRRLQTNRRRFGICIRRKRYKLHYNDLIRYRNKEYRVKSTSTYGKQIQIFDNIRGIISISARNIQLISYGNGIILTRKII